MQLTIPANDHGQIRVFATDLPLPKEVLDKSHDGMLAAFGAPLNPNFVDIVKITDLGDMALTRYIQEGYDMDPDLVEAATVDQITGYAVLILSNATGGKEVELHPGFGLRHITTYSRAPDLTLHDPLPSKGAKGNVPGDNGKPEKSNARIGGMVAVYVLLTMFLLVGAMIYIGG